MNARQPFTNTRMMNLLRKLSVQLILFQVVALYLFDTAFFRFHYFLRADLYEYFFATGKEGLVHYLRVHPGQTLPELIAEPFYYAFYGLLFGLIVVSIFNALKKKSVLNTVLVAILYVLLMFAGAFSGRYLDSWIYFLGKLFSKKIGISNLIASLSAFSLALLLVWLSVQNKLPSNKEKNA